jgi:transposase
MVAETVVEQVVQALGRGDTIAAVARAYGLDRKTVRTWGRRGGYEARAARPIVSRLDPYRAWLGQRAPEVGYNAVVLHRELTEQGFVGSVIIVRRAVAALRQAAVPRVASVRFETPPGEQAQVDFSQVRVWIADAPGRGASLRDDVRLFAPLLRRGLSPPAVARVAGGP